MPSVKTICESQNLRATNVAVEGGGQILGSRNDLSQIGEAHVFTNAKLLGVKPRCYLSPELAKVDECRDES